MPRDAEKLSGAVRQKVRQPHVADLPGLDKLIHGLYLIRDRHLRVVRMQVIQLDRFQLEAAKRVLAGLHNRFGAQVVIGR